MNGEMEYNKSYYQTNKQRILEQMKHTVVCECCNKEVVKSHLNRHQKTKKCQEAKINTDVNLREKTRKELNEQLKEVQLKLERLNE